LISLPVGRLLVPPLPALADLIRAWPGLLAQTGADGDTWLWIGGGVGALVVVGIIAFVVMSAGSKEGGTGKKKGKVHVVTNADGVVTQIGDYRLVNLMSTGNTSQVWDASEISSGRHFGIKMLLPEHVHSQQQRYFLFHEAEVGKKLTHPKIIKILDVFRDKDHPCIVMEFFPSSNLKLRLMHKEPFLKDNFKEIVEQASTALAFMHSKGWVHRDVKPDNILVNASVDLRVIDFALTQRIGKKHRAQGTRSYMSPEQIRGEALDARADLYSFGITLYELLCGRPPFRAASAEQLLIKQINELPASPQAYNPEVSNEMAELILAMLAKKKQDRPADCNEFLIRFRKVRIFKQAPPKKKDG
jgi:serine/threonine protein kinase